MSLSGKALTSKTTGRPAAFHERVRDRIKVSKVVKRVEQCALGKEEMTNVEFQAAKLLINKTIPDLPVTPYDPLAGAKDVSGMSPQALLAHVEGRDDTVTIESDQ